MAIEREIDAWKLFLKGRILQEKGDNKEALNAIDKALSLDPDNTSFLNAKAVALRDLGKGEEASVAQAKSQYRELAQRLVGDRDKPKEWIKGLEDISAKIERAAVAPAEAVTVCW